MAVYRFNHSAEGRRKERDKGYITIHKQREDKPTRFTKEFQFKSAASTFAVSPRAIMELSNPATIYLLGGRPTYIHSKQAYFDAGLHTANDQLNRMLTALVHEQKSKIVLYADQINQRWYQKVKEMHIDIHNQLNYDNAFDIFKDFYDKVIMSGLDMNEYHARMLLIQKLRTAVDLTSDIKRLRIDATKQPQTAEQTIIDIIKGQLEILGLNIKDEDLQLELYSTGRAKDFKNSKKLLNEIKEQIMINYRQACKEVAKTYGSELKKHAQEMVKILETELTNSVESNGMEPLNEAWTVAFSTLKTKIGDLFELMMQTAVNQAFIIKTKGTDWDKIFDKIVIEDVVSAYEKVKDEENKMTTKEAKIDTTLKIKIKNNAFEIPISDKTGQTIVASDIVNQDPNSRNFLKVQEHFSAAIRLQGQYYQKGILGDQRVSSEEFAKDQDDLGRLANYVLYNEYYLGASLPSEFKKFNASLLSYIGWLRLIISIIGVPEVAGEQTPMAIRTSRTIYNTAKILLDFLQAKPTDMVGNMGNGFNQSVIKNMKTLEELWKATTDEEKKDNIKSMMPGNSAAFEAFKSTKSFLIDQKGKPSDAWTYKELYMLFSKELSVLTNKPVLPLISTYFNINLGSMSAII